MPLAVMAQPWDHPDWLWELKYDGFRAFACVESGTCRLVSRTHAPYKSFKTLEAAILATFDQDIVLDGEIVCLDQNGCPQFYDLLWHRTEPWFYAFDVLYLHGRDLLGRPLLERKRILRSLIPSQPCRILYADFVAEHGVKLFEAAVERDLEGVGAKQKNGLYTPEATTWVKVRNPGYSQGEGRRELFRARRARAASATLRSLPRVGQNSAGAAHQSWPRANTCTALPHPTAVADRRSFAAAAGGPVLGRAACRSRSRTCCQACSQSRTAVRLWLKAAIQSCRCSAP
jgi:hypothetical protein